MSFFTSSGSRGMVGTPPIDAKPSPKLSGASDRMLAVATNPDGNRRPFCTGLGMNTMLEKLVLHER